MYKQKHLVFLILFFALVFGLWSLVFGLNISFATDSSPTPVEGTSLGNIEGLGPLGTIITLLSANNVTPASGKLAWVISAVIGIITVVAGIWFMIKILLSGFNIISSSGDKNKMQEAQHAITNSVIGLTVVVAAYALTSLFGKILGIPNILNLGSVIQSLGPK